VLAWQVDGRLPRLRIADPAREEVAASLPNVTSDVVNLRSGPATSYEILDVLDMRTPVTVTGAAREGFLPVSVDGRDAWIAADYLTPAPGDTIAGVTEQVATRSGLLQTANAAPAVIDEPVDLTEELSQPETEVVAEPATGPAPEVVATEPPVVATEPVTRAVEEPGPTGEKWIEVDRSTALVTLHHGDTIVATYQGKIGRDPSPDGYYSTAVGTFHVFMKNRQLTETPFVEGVYLTDFVGFDSERSNGFHSPVRDAAGNVVETQGTVTMGCVRLDEQAAKDLYDFAFIGMRVEIHD